MKADAVTSSTAPHEGAQTADAPAVQRLPTWATWTIGIACIVAAWFVALATPGEQEAQAPFEIPAAIGETATGRNLVVTVTDVRRASEVNADGWTAEGNWLVVDLETQAVLTEDRASLSHADLVVDGNRFTASERPDSLLRQPQAVGIPLVGSLAFELPEGFDGGPARLELALASDPSLDSMIVLSFDLGEVPTVEQTDLLPTEWANP